MIQSALRLAARISRLFHWDILWRIIRRIQRSDRIYLALRIFQDEADYLIFRRNGIVWTAHARDLSITWPLLEQGHFQGGQIQAVLQWMDEYNPMDSSRHWLADVGANIGTTSIPMAVHTDSYVLAIEPFPDNYTLLRRNIRQNNLDHRITCVQSAVSVRGKTATMFMPEESYGGAAVCRRETADENNIQQTAEVPAAPLMDILKSQKIAPEQVALVWSDTEGSEAEIIETGAPLWQAGVPLYVEIFPRALEAQQGTSNLISLINQYFIRFITATELIKHGGSARLRTTSQFSEFLGLLKEKGALTDILLLPKGFVLSGRQ